MGPAQRLRLLWLRVKQATHLVSMPASYANLRKRKPRPACWRRMPVQGETTGRGGRAGIGISVPSITRGVYNIMRLLSQCWPTVATVCTNGSGHSGRELGGRRRKEVALKVKRMRWETMSHSPARR